MKNIGKLAFLGAVLTASAYFPVAAHADTYQLSGKVWELPTFTTVPQASGDAAVVGVNPGSAIYATTPTATFTLGSNTTSQLLQDTSIVGSNNIANYALSSFLTSGGDDITYLTGSSHAADTLNTPENCNGAGTPVCTQAMLFQFTGTTNFGGGTFTLQEDDGIVMYMTNLATSVTTEVINNPGPTSPEVTSSLSIPAGNYSFVIDYAEVDGPPAVLKLNLGLAPTPEPSSLMLLGTGLVSAAGMMFRRRRVIV